MDTRIRKVEYFHATVRDRPGEAYGMLSQLARSGVNLLAFSAVPAGVEHTQLMLFPESVEGLLRAAASEGMILSGPQHAVLIQGDDELGALAEVHRQLSEHHINVFASTGVADGQGGFGYIVFLRSEDIERAATVLGI